MRLHTVMYFRAAFPRRWEGQAAPCWSGGLWAGPSVQQQHGIKLSDRRGEELN
uniref:Uncharacterized protein n=1 Tax=Anguilla anguilla TaxID=7936 RepID=A0A0E9RNZ3_ANGAN